MLIPFNKLQDQFLTIRENLYKNLDFCFMNSNFILGEQVQEFEKDFASYTGTTYSVGVSNGTDAIKLALLSLELSGRIAIYLQANTFISTALAAKEAYPKSDLFLIDIDDSLQIDLNLLSNSLNKNKNNYDIHIIIPTHMFGGMCDMQRLLSLVTSSNVLVLEDSSQAHGTMGKDNRKTGSYGKLGTFSLYPGKNLGAFGDAGIITTNDYYLYKKLLKLRNLGQEEKYVHEVFGFNHRLDTIQGIVLKEKLKYLDTWNESRIQTANKYKQLIKSNKVSLPKDNSFCLRNTYHVFPILCKDSVSLSKFLEKEGIEIKFHYPTPIEETPVFQYLNQNNKNTRYFSKNHISIPIHPFMTDNEIKYVCSKINSW